MENFEEKVYILEGFPAKFGLRDPSALAGLQLQQLRNHSQQRDTLIAVILQHLKVYAFLTVSY